MKRVKMKNITDSDKIESLDLNSMNFAEERKNELLRLFPEIRTEGGKIDFEKLRLTLGEMVDPGKERYGMNWPGKATCFKTIQTPSLGTLLPVKDESINFDETENLIIEGDNLEVLKLLQKSYLGKVKMISVASGYFDGRSDHWKQNRAMGGGAMFDMGVYSLNAARYVSGEEPLAVLAQEKTTRPEIYSQADETTLFQLEFPSGALANCATSLGMNMNYLQVTAEQGWYRLEPFQSYSGIQGASSKGPLNLKIPNQQARQMDDDAQAILNGTALLVPGEEGWRDIRVVEAIHRSATEGKRILIG